MSDLAGKPGELHFSVTVKRKDTGKTETYDLIGHVTAEQATELFGEKQAKEDQ
jgi:hypothetical protein